MNYSIIKTQKVSPIKVSEKQKEYQENESNKSELQLSQDIALEKLAKLLVAIFYESNK